MSRKSTRGRTGNRKDRPLPFDTERVVWDAEYRAEIMAELRRRRLAGRISGDNDQTRDQSAA